MSVVEGDLLWEPSIKLIDESNVTQFMQWLEHEKNQHFSDYSEFRRWSTDDIEGFWAALWEYFDVQSATPYQCVLEERKMPGAKWFPGSSLNFAEHILRNERPDAIALHAYSESQEVKRVSWEELASQVRQVAESLRSLNVKPGDRVVSYLPNGCEAVVAFLASAAVGATFSSCSPDFGYQSVVDRFKQIEPKVLFFTDGYHFGGKDYDRRHEVAEIIEALDSLEHVVQVPNLYGDDKLLLPSAKYFSELLAGPEIDGTAFEFEQVPFDHPLWVLYSSGTTGLPKPIVHGHGGITVEFLKMAGFHMNLKPDSAMFFFTTTGWMMWNLTVGAMIMGGAAVLYDGNPLGNNEPLKLWHIAQDSGTTFFGASPTYIGVMQKQNIVPRDSFDLSKLEGILLGGSPATPEAMSWCYANIKQDLWVTSQSGGTDIASAFVGASPTLPVYAGEIQTRCLGVDARSFDDEGDELIDSVGELVICKPMPSMPVYFWNDKNDERYRTSYFEEFPGVWRHGDYFRVNNRGGCFIYGRSDSTLNRYGVRIGTAEIYRTIESLDEVDDSIIVNLDLTGGEFFMPLFVKLKQGVVLTDGVKAKICQRLRQKYSPRHVPDIILQVSDIPYTLTGKKLEVPVRKILTGVEPSKAANKDAMSNPNSLAFFVEYAKTTQDYQL